VADPPVEVPAARRAKLTPEIRPACAGVDDALPWAFVYRAGMAKQSKLRLDRTTGPETDRAEGPVDDAGSLVVVAGNQNASGYPQGLAAVVVVYALVRLAGLLVRFLRSGARTRP
jgi:hypothetical protein